MGEIYEDNKLLVQRGFKKIKQLRVFHLRSELNNEWENINKNIWVSFYNYLNKVILFL